MSVNELVFRRIKFDKIWKLLHGGEYSLLQPEWPERSDRSRAELLWSSDFDQNQIRFVGSTSSSSDSKKNVNLDLRWLCFR